MHVENKITYLQDLYIFDFHQTTTLSVSFVKVSFTQLFNKLFSIITPKNQLLWHKT
jgi:hypothetical protein